MWALRHFTLAGGILPQPPPAFQPQVGKARWASFEQQQRLKHPASCDITSELRSSSHFANHTARCCQALLVYPLPFFLPFARAFLFTCFFSFVNAVTSILC